jgi:hypothetical protein
MRGRWRGGSMWVEWRTSKAIRTAASPAVERRPGQETLRCATARHVPNPPRDHPHRRAHGGPSGGGAVSRIISANRLVNPDPMTWQNTGQGGYIHGGPNFCTPIEDLVLAWDRCPEVPAVLCSDARAAQPETLPEGTVAYMDPPYLGTTGYAHDLGRPEVVELARRWADAGAVVCISEAEPIPELMADGWHSVDITETRKGQKRTFSKQQREWLTMSEAPKWRPSVALNLFSRGEG